MVFKLGREHMRSKYQTKQRVELLAYLERMSGQHITVNDACEYFKRRPSIVNWKRWWIREL